MKYLITKADIKENKLDILGLMNRNLGEHSEAWFDWKYAGCPCGIPLSCLAKKEETGEIVGMVSLFPRTMAINGKFYKTGILADFSIDKQSRGLGPALNLQKTVISLAKENRINFIYSIPNKLSKQILLRVGYKEIGKIERFVKILRLEYKLKEKVKILFFARILSTITGFFSGECLRERKYARDTHYKFEITNFFDERIDSLWKEVSKNFELMQERTTSFLNWRYNACPTRSYKVFVLRNLVNEVAGYLVYYTENNLYHVVDVLTMDDNRYWYILFSKFSIYARKERVDAITIRFFGNNMIKKRLKKLSFLKRSDMLSFLIYSENNKMDQNIIDKEKMYFFDGDNDI